MSGYAQNRTLLDNVNVVPFRPTGLVTTIHTADLGVGDGSECCSSFDPQTVTPVSRLKTAGSIISVLVWKNEKALIGLS